MKRRQPTHRGYVSISGGSYARLSAYAQAQDRSVSAIVTQLLADSLVEPAIAAPTSARPEPGQTRPATIKSRP